MTLYNALDAWSWSNSSYDVSGWNIDDGPNGYPLPSAIYRSDIR